MKEGFFISQWASSVYHSHRCIADEAIICCRWLCFFVCNLEVFWIDFSRSFVVAVLQFWKCRGLGFSLFWVFQLFFAVSVALDVHFDVGYAWRAQRNCDSIECLVCEVVMLWYSCSCHACNAIDSNVIGKNVRKNSSFSRLREYLGCKTFVLNFVGFEKWQE